MKLSEAIMLGDSLRKRHGGAWLIKYPFKSVCGCALGGAYLAIGKTMEDYNNDHRDFVTMLKDTYPWFSESESIKIGEMFVIVMRGHETLEGIADYVRSIEPDCGECNRFNCDCTKDKVPIQEEQYAEARSTPAS